MRIPKNLPTPRTLVYLTLVIVVLGCLPVLIYARQFVQPFSLQELEQKALEAAQQLGFQGESTVQTSIQTTLEKWYALHDESIASTVNRHTPILMMSLRGEVRLSGDTYDSLTLALDARTGQLISYSTQYFALDALDLASLPAPEIYIPSPIPLPPHALTAQAMPYPGKPTPDRNYTPVP